MATNSPRQFPVGKGSLEPVSDTDLARLSAAGVALPCLADALNAQEAA